MPVSLPALLGEQYMLTAFLRETPTSRIYAARQKGMSREVVVESLKRELAGDVEQVEAFASAARTQAQVRFPWMAAALQLLYADGSWHMVRERLAGETLDILAISGRKLPGLRMLALLQKLCHFCIFLDIEGIASEDFSLAHIAMLGDAFSLDNTLRPGVRRRTASRRYLARAAEQLKPFLNRENDPLAAPLAELMERMQHDSKGSILSPLWYDEELCVLRSKPLGA